MSETNSTESIARRLVELCRQGNWEQAHRELYAPDAVSIEPAGPPSFGEETKGMAAIGEKGRKWQASVEKIHSSAVSDPVVAGSSFACVMSLDMTFKGQGRMKGAELCVYEVKNGKVVSERFFR